MLFNKKRPVKSLVQGAQVRTLNNLISQAIDAESTLRAIRCLGRLRGMVITFRPHPEEDIETWKYLFIKSGIKTAISDEADQPFADWLKDVKYIVGLTLDELKTL